MMFRPAAPGDRPRLTALWAQAFGDPVSFIDLFFESGFSPERSRVCVVEGQLAAMLYWFDCSLGDQRYAYIYAVATDKAFQGRGIASRLMADTHRLLYEQGYQGAILSPGSDSLFGFYRRMGYETAGLITETTLSAGTPLPVREIGTDEFAALRPGFLPENGVIQDGANLAYLKRFGRFYTGEGFLAAVTGDRIAEFLGDETLAPGLIGALGLEKASLRRPGTGRPFVMGLRFDGSPFSPIYFGFVFD